MRRAMAAVAMMLVVACSGDAGQAVALSMDPSVRGSTILVEGTTDLPDGALIAYEVTHEALATTDETMDLVDDGVATVQDGRYSVSVPISGWPPGDVSVWVAFQTLVSPGSQPPDVIERFGEMGEHLTGDNVTDAAGLKRVEVEQDVTVS